MSELASEPLSHGVATFLEWARVELDRVEPREAAALQRDGALLVDIRPLHDRLVSGEIPGAVVIERIVLEWRLDPQGTDHIPGVTPDRRVIVFCNEGYASSLAARDLKRIGLPHATDLIGGFHGWVAAGLPVHNGGTQAIT